MAVVGQQVGVRDGVGADHAGDADGRGGDEDEVSSDEVSHERRGLRHAKAPGHGSRKKAEVRHL